VWRVTCGVSGSLDNQLATFTARSRQDQTRGPMTYAHAPVVAMPPCTCAEMARRMSMSKASTPHSTVSGGKAVSGKTSDTVAASINYSASSPTPDSVGNLFNTSPSSTPKSSLDTLMGGSDAIWYAADISKSKCQKAVSHGDHGDFLVRKASKTHYVMMVKDTNKVAMFDILSKPDLGILDLQGRKHPTIDDIVMGVFRRHLIGPYSGTVLYLGKPVDVQGGKKKRKVGSAAA
jgi:hypothetical protein